MIDHRMQALMREATRLTRAGRLADVSAILQKALSGLGSTAAAPGPQARPGDVSGPGPTAFRHRPADQGEVLDGLIVEVPEAGRPTPDHSAPDRPGTDGFIAGSYRHGNLSRDYKLYVPPAAATGPAPLVVMLHGCTQDADDFAAGTAMNRHAREEGFFVLYPAQSAQANPSRCWNWFKHNHQHAERGEPALIASLTRMLIARHGLDARRVAIAGLSAGGAMAAIVAAEHPDLFAAVGVHSGLPVGAANGVTEALAAMKSGRSHAVLSAKTRGSTSARRVPVIVFHGDQDTTVNPRNGSQVIADVVEPAGLSRPRVERGRAAGGRSHTRSVYTDEAGRVHAELWLVHGGGHAWFGGSTAGSYVDATGPDATAEMLRFFREHGVHGGLPPSG